MEYQEETRIQAKTWKAIYPQYINKNKSVSEGRKIGKELAISNPTIAEIAQAVKSLRLHAIVETDKSYPKDWMVKGRIKVQIFNDQHKPINSQIHNKLALMKKIVEFIRELPARKEKPEGNLIPGSKEHSMELTFLENKQQQQQQQQKEEETVSKKKGKGRRNK